MKTIAYWSSNHKLAARILIAICHILIIYLAWYVGIGLQQHHMLLSPAVFYISVSVFLSCNLLFTQCYHFFSFNKRKLLDFVVGFCSFIIVISITNLLLSEINENKGGHLATLCHICSYHTIKMT